MSVVVVVAICCSLACCWL